MENLIRYRSDFDELNSQEIKLLEKAAVSVREFIQISKKISHVSYATRAAHSKSYAVAWGTLQIHPTIPNWLRMIFPEENYETTARFSHSNPIIFKSKHEVPAYGISLKIKAPDRNILFPLVNFPLFPTNSVSGFLKFFTSMNTFLTTKADNFVVSAMDLPALLLHSRTFFPGIFSPDIMKHAAQLLFRKNDFILSFPFHSIGCFRLGDFIMKIKLIPIEIEKDFAKNERGEDRIYKYFSQQEAQYKLVFQLCSDLNRHPVNDLTKMWRNATEIEIGILTLPKNSLLNVQDPEVEALVFNPFDNPEQLQPVGKIQQLRNIIYQTAAETRNEINSKEIIKEQHKKTP